MRGRRKSRRKIYSKQLARRRRSRRRRKRRAGKVDPEGDGARKMHSVACCSFVAAVAHARRDVLHLNVLVSVHAEGFERRAIVTMFFYWFSV